MKVWHYITKRSDNIQVGDYYRFHSGHSSFDSYDRIKPDKYLGDGVRVLLLCIPFEDIILMRINGKRLDYVWKAIQLSKRRSYTCIKVLGKLIEKLSTASG